MNPIPVIQTPRAARASWTILARTGCVVVALGGLAGCPTDGGSETSSSSSSSSSSGTPGSSSSSTVTTSGSQGSGSSAQGTSTSSGSSGVSGSQAGSGPSSNATGSSNGTSTGGSSGTTSSAGSSGGSSGTLPEGVTDCGRTLPVPAAGDTCVVAEGDGNTLLEGTVLAGEQSLRGGQVLVGTNGNILCAACDCSATAGASTATKVSCPNGVITPGLINAHDHLTYNQEAPYVPAAVRVNERYEHRNDWRSGNNGHFEIPYSNGGDTGSLRGELRQVLGGTTAINGSNGVEGLARNPDRTNLNEGLTGGAVFYDVFPLGTSQRLTSGCGYNTKPNPTASNIANSVAYTPHISEGIDLTAYNEFQCLSRSTGGGVDVVLSKTGIIHGIGLRAPDYALMAVDGAALIWSPRSNISLYGHTAQTPMAHRLGVEIALGTDWTPSGSINLLRELACARDLNGRQFGGYFTDRDLWKMVTLNGARALGIDSQVGSLAVGKKADIAIFRGDDLAGGGVRKDWRAVVDAHVRDVALVLRGGLPLTGDKTLMEGLTNGATCEVLDVCGVDKRVCAQRETGTAASAIVSAAAAKYPIIFCGDVPTNEPTCVPSRLPPAAGGQFNVFPFTPGDANEDTDGDGVPNATDNCPTAFNPARPMDAAMQPDFDGDSVGDACDVCPLNANATTCTPPDPNDQDGDSVPDAMDNCPAISNMDQMNSDQDEKGDLCDACRTFTNMGAAPCPATIYAIKRGDIGGNVTLSNLLVTAVGPTGYFVAHVTGDAAYAGEDFSGLFVFTNTMGAKPAVGDRINIANGSLVEFSGQTQLQNAPFTVVMPGQTLPAPIVVANPADIATDGMRAAALEGLLVRVNNVTVTDIAPMPGNNDRAPTNEFLVTGGLRVNDYFYLAAPFPAVNDPLTYVQGVLRIFNDVMKVEPRSEADLGVALRLTSISPEQAFVNVGDMNVPALTVSLNRPAEVDTPVTLVSSDINTLTVPMSVMVLTGQTVAQVPVTALMQAMSVTVSATYEGVTRMASVRTVGATETPVVVSVTPAATTVAQGGTLTFTVTLDIPPPPAGSTVTLALDPTTAGTVPASVTLQDFERTTTFDLVAGDTPGMVTVSATLGATVTSTVEIVPPRTGGVVISQVYGGGGNSGAPLRNDFVELFNAGNVAQNLSGWRLQYASFDGNFGAGNGVALTGSIAPGKYLLVQFGSGGMVGSALPMADISLTTTNLSAANGKVVLVNSGTFSGSGCPWTMPPTVVDYVGFGTANCGEGGLARAAAGSNTQAIVRKGNGCTDTGNNSMDFQNGAPTPRNSASPATTCN